ncbi:MAG: glycosyltransferase family 39 protein [Acidobacteriia bacterium]|nr:glycosyltransferase family 39 protein [Terriglobia bacterium]
MAHAPVPMRVNPQVEPLSSNKAATLARTLQWTLLAGCILRLWLLPLPSSFWVDELVTEFVVHHPGHPSFAMAPQVPASIYYRLPAVSESWFGLSEISYRLPSVLCMGLALLIIARLASRLIHPNAAWFAAFACLGLRGINYFAADARPYAMGICVSAASLFFLVRWLDSAWWLDALLFAAFAALLWPIHLVYWPFYSIYALYIGLRLWRHETKVSMGQAIAVLILVFAALVPEAVKAYALLREAGSHVVAAVPGIREFEHAARWNLAFICGTAAWILARVFGWKANRARSSSTSLILILAWWLSQPVFIFLFSHITGNSIFVERYLSIALPGAALTATAVAAMWIPADCWRGASLVLGAGVFLIMGQWSTSNPRHGNSDWRAAAQDERRLAYSEDTPVVCLSPFIEARSPKWSPDYPLPGFLYAHLPGYPVTGKPYLLPFGDYAADGEPYAARLTRDVLSHSNRFLIYGANRHWRAWFHRRPELTGWVSTLKQFGDVQLVVFDNPGTPPRAAMKR